MAILRRKCRADGARPLPISDVIPSACPGRPCPLTGHDRSVHLVGVRDGRIVRFQEFFDTYAAAEAFRA